MMTSVTLALGFLAVSASPTFAQPEDVSSGVESFEPESYEMDTYGDSGCQDCGGCSSCGHGYGCWHYHCLKWRSPCNLSQHVPYYPAAHGYYYFRPYNHNSVGVHAEMVRKWGGDHRNPYSNKLFERLYEEVEAEGEGGPFQDDQPEELRPATEETLQQSTKAKPGLLFPDETARRSVIRKVRPVHFENNPARGTAN